MSDCAKALTHNLLTWMEIAVSVPACKLLVNQSFKSGCTLRTICSYILSNKRSADLAKRRSKPVLAPMSLQADSRAIDLPALCRK